jgi:hypothetical protein
MTQIVHRHSQLLQHLSENKNARTIVDQIVLNIYYFPLIPNFVKLKVLPFTDIGKSL